MMDQTSIIHIVLLLIASQKLAAVLHWRWYRGSMPLADMPVQPGIVIVTLAHQAVILIAAVIVMIVVRILKCAHHLFVLSLAVLMALDRDVREGVLFLGLFDVDDLWGASRAQVVADSLVGVEIP